MSGTGNPTGIHCTNATVALAVANALRTGGTYTGSSDGFTWEVGACGSGTELSAMGSICSCPSPGYIVRPCIGTGNTNWGGINTATCGGGSQTMTVTFNYGVSCGTTFGYTGALQTYTVPGGVTSVTLDVQGAMGGTGYNVISRGGYGGRTQCALAVTPGQVLNVFVGNVGGSGGGGAGGYNGGASGITYGAGGGGASDIRVGGTALSNRVVVAGGGGGGAYNYGTTNYDRGGAGGGITGEAGYSGNVNTPGLGGYGGTQLAGGAGGSYSYPTYAYGLTGGSGVGGAGVNTGAGGGGGYYGGGGGDWSGGGGGSNYAGTGTSSVTHTQGYNTTGVGQVVITPVVAAPTGGTITGTLSACVGSTTTLTDATGTSGGVWTSSVTTVATVGSTGIVTGVSGGTSVISYTITNCGGTASAFATVTINPFPVVAAIGGPISVTVGSTITLSDATSGGTWASSATSIATIGTSGIVSGVSTGTTTISYSVTNGCGTTSVTQTITVTSACIATFSYTGAVQTYTVPVGTTSIAVDMQGAIGGTGYVAGSTSRGGFGGRVQCNLAVTAGQMLSIFVGGTGGNGVAGTSAAAGFNDAGAIGGHCTTITNYGGGGGGGSSDIRIGGTALSNRVVVAGGGGGGACNLSTDFGGNGGGLTGQTAPNPGVSEYGGPGGTQLAGGAGGTYAPYGTSGSGTAGLGGVASTAPTNVPGSAGGGGGGGYYGGAGGSWGGGGGGSSYANSLLASSVTHTQGFNTTTNGIVTFTLPSVLPTAGTITGTGTICGTSTTALTDATGTPGGVWTSSVTTVATVGSSTGIVTGVSAGTSVISYTISNCAGTVQAVTTVTVSTGPGSITGTPGVCIGSTTALTDATGGGTWSSSTTTVGTVASGVVTGVAAGTTTITYSMGAGCISTTAVTVNAPPTAVTVSGAGTFCNTATITASGGAGGTIYFQGTTSGGTSTASPSSSQVVSASGTYFFRAQSSAGCWGTQGSATIAINPLPSAITGPTSLCTGSLITLSDVGGGSWSSSTTTVASIGSGSGVVSGLTIGTSTITYTLPVTSCFTTTVVTVTSGPSAITAINPVCISSPTAFVDGGGGTWTSSNTLVATIGSSSGIVSGVVTGTSTITYSFSPTCFVTSSVTINAAVGSITGTKTVCTSFTTPLTDATTGGAWTSSSTGLATVSAGIVSGVAAGTSTISYAVSAGCIATTAVTVNSTPNVTTPSNQTVCNGVSTAAVTFSGSVGGTTFNWTNTTPGIGLASSGSGNIAAFTAVNLGSAAVTATITVTPVTASCTGTPQKFTITVNPTPTVTAPSNQTVCNGVATTAVTFSGAVAGTTYNWTNTAPGIGLAASGSGNIASFAAINLGTATVTATITVTPTASSCGGTSQSFTITVNPTPTVTAPSNQTLCNGIATTAVTFSGAVPGATYNWTNSTPSIGLAASGSGNIASFTATNLGSAAVTATITVTPTASGCGGTAKTFTITVNPTPTVNTITSQTLCNGTPTTAVTFSGAVTGTTYNWINTTSSIGLASSGSGNIASFTATNLSTAAVTATITVTPSASSCAGSPKTFNITVNPTPNVTAPSNQTLCNGAPTTAVTFSGAVPATTFNWTNTTPGIGLASSGSGNIASFSAVNVGTAAVTATITVTPSTSTCTGPSQSFTITVNPTPTVVAPSSQTLCNGAFTTAVNFTGAVLGTTYNWTNTTPGIGLASSGSGNIGSFTATNSGTSIVTATITVTPTASGCPGTSQSFTITVDPTPTVVAPANQVLCHGFTTAPVTFSGPVGGTTYNWTNTAPGIGLASSGSGNIASFVATNPGSSAVTATITVTPTANGCPGIPQIFTIMVNPLPAPILGTTTLCVNNVSILSDATPLGTWSSSNTALATVGLVTGAVTGISGLSFPIVTYMLPTGCIMTTTVTVNPLPSAISGGLPQNVCVGQSVSLVDGGTGIWTSSNTGLATITPSGGVATGVVAGVPTITFTFTSTGCFTTTPLTVNPLPASITGASSVCTGLTTTLNDATSGGIWSSSATTVATVGTSGIVTGVAVAGGPANISYTLSTGCSVTYPFTVNPLPVPFTLSIPPGLSSGSYCSGGTGLDIQLASSTSGVNYQLYNAGPVGSPLGGTGVALDFGKQTLAGVYTAVATNATTGCIRNMPGTVTITISSLPNVSALTTTNGGAYCAGGAGVDIFDSMSATGINYQLLLGGVPLYTPLPGTTGTKLDFGTGFGVLFTTPGVYTATATDALSGCSVNVLGSITVIENPLPAVFNVTGGGSYCAGGTGVRIGLTYSTTGINFQLWNGSTMVTTLPGSNSGLDFGLQTGAGIYTVIAVNPLTGCSSNMAGSAGISINPLPNIDTVQGGGSYCVGGTGVKITLSGSDAGIYYQLYEGGGPVGGIVAGTGASFSFGLETISGIYTAVATDATTGCTVNMYGSAVVGSYPLPAVFRVSAGAASYCAGGPGVDITLSGSASGIKYYLYNAGILIDSMMGTGSLLDYGLRTLGGSYTVVAVSTSTGCTSNMTGAPVVTINALPVAYIVTGGGSYCAGSGGVHIGLSFSDPGVDYQLWKSGAKIGSAAPGTSSALDFGIFTITGTYTIVATNRVTLCSSNMTGSAIITSSPLPNVYTVSGGGGYCAGGAGLHVYVSGSEAGINYQLYNVSTPVGGLIAGTGGKLDMGLQIATGLYTVVAIDPGTLCSVNMSGSTVININALPTVFNVTGGGNYCAGGTGVHVGLSGSTPGINYTLLNSGVPVPGGLKSGTGSALDFGLQIAGGTYSVMATNAITGCTINMSGSVTIVIDPLPNSYAITGGGAYCAGTGGAHIGLSGSDPGVGYQLFSGGVPVGPLVPGTGIAIDFGPQTTVGTYTVIGSNIAAGCTSNMTGTVKVSINLPPSAYTVTGGGHFCAGGTGSHVYLSGSHNGITYQLLNGGMPVGLSVNGSGAGLDFGAQAASGTYTAVAADPSTGCVADMISAATITVDPLPAAFVVGGGGHYCAGGAGVIVNLSGSERGVNYQLFDGHTPSGLPIGGTGTLLSFGLQTAVGTYSIVGSNYMTSCINNMTGSVSVVADPLVVPSVTISSSKGSTTCIGVPSTFTALPVNGGASPSFGWTVGGLLMGTADTFAYIPSDGDIIAVTLNSDASCASSTTATNALTMKVLPYKLASATVTTNPGNNVCQGTPVSFTATPSLAGTTPGCWWLKNSLLAGSGTTFTYTPNGANNGDVIEFMLKSSYLCPVADTVFSDPVVMIVDSGAVPSFVLTSHLGQKIGVGQVDTFFATVTPVAGYTYSYQWELENTPVPGANQPIYIDYEVFNGDDVRCVVTKVGACGDQSLIKSTIVHLSDVGVKPVTTAGSNISVLPNPNKGEFVIKGTLGTNADEEVSLEITDMLGQVVYSNKIIARNGEMDEKIQLTRNIANGMYLLSLRSSVCNNVYHIVVEQ
jgi:glycine rich protein/type IX secretion system substrate protein